MRWDPSSAKYTEAGGNKYYHWNAATADSGIAIDPGADAEDSVCPSGWNLLDSSSLYNLFRDIYSITDLNPAHSNKVRSLPMQFTLTGYCNDSASLFQYGDSGRYWQSRKTSGTRARDLYIDQSRVTTGNVDAFDTHQPIRCEKIVE